MIFKITNKEEIMKKALSIATICMLAGIALICSCTFHSDADLTIALGGAPAEIDFWETIIREFENESGATIELLRQPSDTDQRRQQLIISLRARQATPDVFLIDVAWLAQFAASGWLEPLNDYVARDNLDLNAFFTRVVDMTDIYEKKLIALPVYVDGGLLYYRKDLLDAHGYEPPQTWNQLVEYSKKIQDEQRETNPAFYGFVWQGAQYEGLVCNFIEYAVSNNGGITISSSDKIIDTEQNIEAVNFMYDLIHTYKISPENVYTELKEDETRLFFQQGNALFERNWPYAWALHQSDESPVKDKVGIVPLPHFEGGESAAALGGWHVGISHYSDAKDLAWQFVKYITSYDVQKRCALEIGWNPGRQDVYTDKGILAKLPYFERLRTVFEHAVARPYVPYYTQLSQIIQRYLNTIIAGKQPAQKGLSEAEKELKSIVEQYEKD